MDNRAENFLAEVEKKEWEADDGALYELLAEWWLLNKSLGEDLGNGFGVSNAEVNRVVTRRKKPSLAVRTAMFRVMKELLEKRRTAMERSIVMVEGLGEVLPFGTRVRYKPEKGNVMGKFGSGMGTVVMQPIGSQGVPPPGGLYVLWNHLREPAPAFVDDLEIIP